MLLTQENRNPTINYCETAKALLFAQSKQKSFPEVLQELQVNKPLDKKCKLLPFPFLDETDLRVQDRLRNPPLKNRAKYLISLHACIRALNSIDAGAYPQQVHASRNGLHPQLFTAEIF